MPHAAIYNENRNIHLSKVGVLSVQGDFAEHIAILKLLDMDVVEVRLPEDLNDIGALILPGGESTCLDQLITIYGLKDRIKEIANSGIPIWGTCAGMILIASKLQDSAISPIDLIDITVARNAYGRQVNSFEEDLEIPTVGLSPFRGVFIRAPLITDIRGTTNILARLRDGTPVAVQKENILATAFHPELTNDLRFHKYFLALMRGTN